MNQEKINARQFFILILLTSISSSILLAPPALAMIAKGDAWLSVLIATVFVLLLVCLYNRIGSLASGLSLFQWFEKVLGKWLGKGISFLYISFGLILSSLILRSIGNFIVSQMLPETPIEAIQILMLFVVSISVRLGIETTARASEIFFPFIIILFLILNLFVLPNLDIQNIQPFLTEGLKPVFRGTLIILGAPFMGQIMHLTIFPSVKKPDRAKLSFLLGAFWGNMILFLITLITLLVLGPEITAIHTAPAYAVAKEINVGQFVQRIEVLLALFWIMTIFIHLTTIFFSTVIGITQTLHLKAYKPMVFPMAILIYFLSQINFPSFAYYQSFYREAWFPFSSFFGLVLPTLILIIAYIRDCCINRNK